VRGNYLRKRVHRMDSPLTASKLQVIVTATHGYPAARLFEIRVVEAA
jgi:hypothetical protein